MKHAIRMGFVAATLAVLTAAHAGAQVESIDTAAVPQRDVIAVVSRLFVAMQASDTAAARTTFLPGARVIPISENGPANGASSGLTVDQFVAFSGRNPAGTWIERIWSPHLRVSGPLAELWFEYDVYNGATPRSCGVNSVQLQRSSDGWKIFTMAFTSATTGCPARARP
jgi:hypothetical protein